MPRSLHAISARRTRSLPGRLGRTLFALALSALLSGAVRLHAQGTETSSALDAYGVTFLNGGLNYVIGISSTSGGATYSGGGPTITVPNITYISGNLAYPKGGVNLTPGANGSPYNSIFGIFEYTLFNQSAAAGANATFATLVNDGTPTYVWQIFTDNGTTWTSFGENVPMSSGTYPLSFGNVTMSENIFIDDQVYCTLTVSNVTLSMNGWEFRVMDTNAGSISSGAFLTVLPLVLDTPPGNQTASAGSTVTLSTHIISAINPSYQWLKNAIPIKGATKANLTLTDVQSKDAASYSVKVSNKLGSAQSSGNLTVTKSAPTIITPPTPATVKSGSKATFTVTAQGTNPLFYHWYKNNRPLTNNRTTSGAFTPTLILSQATSASQGTYQVTIINSLGKTTSTPVSLTVN